MKFKSWSFNSLRENTRDLEEAFHCGKLQISHENKGFPNTFSHHILLLP